MSDTIKFVLIGLWVTLCLAAYAATFFIEPVR